MITIKDIAKVAKVSVSTVSAVLGDKKHCYASADTKNRIKDAARELKYFPNVMSQAMKGLPTHTVGILGHVFSIKVRSELIAKLSNGLWNAGYQALIGDSMLQFGREEEILKRYIQRGVDAIIITDGTDINKLREIISENIPFVICEVYSPDGIHEYLAIDKAKGAYLATNHLIEHCHKNIAFYTLCLQSNKKKHQGYLAALADKHLQPFLVEARDYPECKNEEQALKDALGLVKEKQVTGFVCTNDSLAAKLIRTLHKHQIRVPEDIAIIGYDGLDFTALTTPSITTVKQPIQKLADVILENILNAIKEKKTDLEKKLVEPKLVIRESCGCKSCCR